MILTFLLLILTTHGFDAKIRTIGDIMYREEKDRKELAKAYIKLKQRIDDNRTLRNLFEILSITIGTIFSLIAPGAFGMAWIDSIMMFMSLGAAGAGAAGAICYGANRALLKEKTGLDYDDYLDAERTKKMEDYVNELSLNEVDVASAEAEPSRLNPPKPEMTPTEYSEEQTRPVKALYKKLGKGRDINALETKIINDEAAFNFEDENQYEL